MAFTDETIMPFGKFKGTKLANVPSSYLLWWYDARRRGEWPDLSIYIKENMDVLQKEAEQEKLNKQ